MQRRIRMILCLVTALLLAVCLPGLAEEDGGDLIYNGTIDSLDGWYKDMWDSASGVSYLSLSDEGYDDNTSLCVENTSENDARWIQDVWVEPNTTYRISAYVKAEGCGEENIGATISIKDIYVYSESVWDTAGEWKYIELYGTTGAEQTSLTLCCRVGGYSSTNVGKAWFDNISMTAVDSVPVGMMTNSFATPTPAAEEEETEDDEPARDTPALILIAFLFAMFAFAGCASIRRIEEGDLTKRGHAETPVFCVLLVAAFVFRIYLAVRFPGYRVDMNCFEAWSARMASGGLTAFYDPGNYFCDYPPVYLMMLTVMEFLRRLLGIAAYGTVHGVLIKLWPILFDLLGAALIYRVGRKRIGATAAAALGAFQAFNIAAMCVSAAWGQADSVLSLLICLTIVFAIEKKWTPALLLYALAVLTKPQALLFAPVGVAFYLGDVIREKKPKLLLSAVAAVLMAYIVMLPFSIGLYEGFAAKLLSPFTFLVQLFTSSTSGYSYMTVNALNLYDALNLNWKATSAYPAMYTAAWVLMIAGMLYGCVLAFRSKKRPQVLLIAAAVITWIYAFGPMMHERYLFPAMLLLALYYAYERDRRVMISLVVTTVTVFLNAALVLQGGMGSGNYGHLQSSEQWINTIVSVINILNALYLTYVETSVCLLDKTVCFRTAETPVDPPEAERLRTPGDHRLHLTLRDWLIMGITTAVYAVVAFTNLGSLSAPQTEWVSAEAGEQVVFDLGETKCFRMEYYGGICDTYFTVALSDDGETWSEDFTAEYDQGDIFRWFYYVPKTGGIDSFSNAYSLTREKEAGAPDTNFAGDTLEDADLAAFDLNSTYPPQKARYIRITCVSAGLRLREIGFLDANGDTLPVTVASHTASEGTEIEDAVLLIDEQDTVPAVPSYYNSTYFDEIYHARTGYEFQQGLSTYEWTHPPLGKVFIMFGIDLFGMTPFGWRFMGTLFGVVMVPLMYLLAKQLTHRTDLSTLAMLFMTLDSMHFTQSRLATVDTYAVFFIMLMYLFMFRYRQMNWNHGGLGKTLIPLGLCGISMGLGIASKWIGLYAAIGLAVIFFSCMWQRFTEYRYCKRNRGAVQNEDAIVRSFWPNLFITGGFCILFFIVIPAVIYYLSYYWQLQCEGGLNISRVLQLQQSMLNYHAGLGGDTHYFRSEWYEWPVIWWPMWYYSGTSYMQQGVISSISCMGNPAVWWPGLLSLFGVLTCLAVKKRKPDSYHLVIIGFLAQYLPWVLVPRSTFIYHYFASVPFIILCTVLMLDRIRAFDKKAFRISAVALTVAALLLFIAFYPLESGMPVARAYAQYLRWFKWYNF